MGIKKRQYTKEQKEELVQSLLSGQTALGLGREHNISPSLINRLLSTQRQSGKKAARGIP
jgi:transposase-like protein